MYLFICLIPTLILSVDLVVRVVVSFAHHMTEPPLLLQLMNNLEGSLLWIIAHVVCCMIATVVWMIRS